MRAAEQLESEQRRRPQRETGAMLRSVPDADEPVRYGRPPARALRFLKAYWTTFAVIISYLTLRFTARFRSTEGVAQALARKHRRNARRIEKTIISLQGMYIKVGQLISIMTNFLPEEFRQQLEGLQDAVPPRPFKDIEARLREEFDGKGPDELFARFDEVPVASASIGQVHVAKLHDGTRVAVKVQYPDIETIVKSDLKTLRRIMRIVSWFVPYKGLDAVYREIRAMLLEELDFRLEADNVDRVASNFEDRSDVAFPFVERALSTSRILTTHFEDGVKVGDLARLDELGIDREALARTVVELYCQQIFTDGVYHADPHPGNLLVRPCADAPDGFCIVFLDFGAVAEVSAQMRTGIVELIQAALTRDTPRIVAAMKSMGFIARGADDRVFDRVVEYFHQKFQDQISLDSLNLRDIRFDPDKSLENLADLRRMDISIRELTENFDVPKEWILLERTLLLLMGLCTALDPAMNPMTTIRPYVERFVLGDEGDWSEFVVETTKDLLSSVTALPAELRKFISSARAGDLAVRFQGVDRATNLMYRLGQQAILAAVGITGAALAVVLEGRGELERAEYGWWTTKVCAALFVLSWWRSRGLLRRKHG
jgi:predicted unusual protein kinase regulating ubiquinone biosynthesis (AarF/ABC1/UbiB family)